MARLCLERGDVDLDLAPILASQREAIVRQRQDLDRLENELLDLELTIAAAGRARRTTPVPDPIRVLFICTHNSARSQIAEALLGHYGGSDFLVRSAGTEATRVNPFAVQVLAEVGIDWSSARSKVLTEFLDEPWDYVITVCDRARAVLPGLPRSDELAPLGPRRPVRGRGNGPGEARGLPPDPDGGRDAPPPVHRDRAARRRPPAGCVARVRAHVAEFIGTFVLVFAGCGAIAVGRLDTAGIAVAFGLAIAVMVYAFGHVSGAHFNPAVSIGFALGRHFPWPRVVTYGIAQVAGAIAAAAALRWALGDVPLGVTSPSVPVPAAIAIEAVFTGILMLVITAVATDTRAVGEAAALAIGGAVTLGALVAGPVTGASLNPARSIGPAVVSGDLGDLWIYLVGPVLGAIAGATLYRWVRAG